MARVELVTAGRAPLLARPFYQGGGDPAPIGAALANVPELLRIAGAASPGPAGEAPRVR